MALCKQIEALKQFEKKKPGGILSIYLNTDGGRPGPQQGQWKIRLKNGLKKLEEYLDAQGATEEKKCFSKLSKKAESYVQQLQRDHQKGLVFFASHDFDIWEMEMLQVPVNNSFHWEQKAVLDQLEALNRQFPPCGIIQAQKDQVRILDLSLGQVLDEFCYPIEQEALIKREFKQWIPKLQKQARKRNWKGLYLVGEPAHIDMIKKHFQHLPIINIISKNVNAHSPQDLIAKVM